MEIMVAVMEQKQILPQIQTVMDVEINVVWTVLLVFQHIVNFHKDIIVGVAPFNALILEVYVCLDWNESGVNLLSY